MEYFYRFYFQDWFLLTKNQKWQFYEEKGNQKESPNWISKMIFKMRNKTNRLKKQSNSATSERNRGNTQIFCEAALL